MHDPVNRGVPDGMKVDKKGHLFVSGPNGIWVWNSKGVHIGTVQMPKSMANLTSGRSRITPSCTSPPATRFIFCRQKRTGFWAI